MVIDIYDMDPTRHTNSSAEFILRTWRVKPATNELVGDEATRRVEHKVMRLLVYLANNAGRDLSRDQILSEVWGDGVHNDEVLTVAVSSLRKALDDDPRSPRFVKTVPRYGYHMLEAGRPVETTPAPLSITAMNEPARGFWVQLADRIGPRFLTIAVLVAFLLFVILVQVVVEIVHLITR